MFIQVLLLLKTDRTATEKALNGLKTFTGQAVRSITAIELEFVALPIDNVSSESVDERLPT